MNWKHWSLAEWLIWLEEGSDNKISYEQQFAEVKQFIQTLKIKLKPVVITVGGTNGKGSCVALLESIYMNAGYRVGSFTSPHLLKFNERIRLDGKSVDEVLILDAFKKIRAKAPKKFSYFEMSFLAALLIFQIKKLDVIILEVGIGGRLDATNTIEPDVSVITNIALDHCDKLGKTRREIAIEKAGIMREDKPVVCGDSKPPSVLFDQAREIGAKLSTFDVDFEYQVTDRHWSWMSGYRVLTALPLPNVYLPNAAVVLKVIEILNPQLPVEKSAICKGLLSVQLPGRLQRIERNDFQIILDVAHNPASFKVLANYLQHIDIAKRLTMIVGMMGDKAIEASLAPCLPLCDKWYIVDLKGARAAQADKIGSILQGIGAENVEIISSPIKAFEKACDMARQNDIIVVCGSFVLVGEILRQLR